MIRITNKIHTIKVINTNLIIVEHSFINYWISLLKMFEMSHWILKYEHDLKDELCEYQNIPVTIMSNHLYEKFTQKYVLLREGRTIIRNFMDL